MKLPIKKKYFDQIKNGDKIFEFRDAHITFVSEETGETLRRNVTSTAVHSKTAVEDHYGKMDDVLEDDNTIVFYLNDPADPTGTTTTPLVHQKEKDWTVPLPFWKCEGFADLNNDVYNNPACYLGPNTEETRPCKPENCLKLKDILKPA